MPDPPREDEEADYLPPWMARLRVHPSSPDLMSGSPQHGPGPGGRPPALRLLAAIAVPVAAAGVIIVAWALHLAGVLGAPVASPSPATTASPTTTSSPTASATPASTSSTGQTITVPSGVSAGSLTCLDARRPSADDCWAVGSPPPEVSNSILDRWSGSSWEVTAMGGADTGLDGIACPPSTSTCYAVGGSVFLTHTGP